MATAVDLIKQLAGLTGADIKSILEKLGDLTALTTTEKGSLVGALNELKGLIDAIDPASIIDDEATATTSTWSSDKINTAISAAIAALVDGAPAALDTLNELAAALGDDPNAVATITTALGNRVRFDAAQTLTTEQKTQARDNIGAASAADIGDLTVDLAAYYAAAKA